MFILFLSLYPYLVLSLHIQSLDISLTSSPLSQTVENMKRFSDDPRLVTACTDFLQTVCGLVAEQLSPDPGDPNDSAFATDRAHMTSLKVGLTTT